MLAVVYFVQYGPIIVAYPRHDVRIAVNVNNIPYGMSSVFVDGPEDEVVDGFLSVFFYQARVLRLLNVLAEKFLFFIEDIAFEVF